MKLLPKSVSHWSQKDRLHFCVDNGLSVGFLADLFMGPSTEFFRITIVDAGGGIIDFSSYVKNGDSFTEVAASWCVYIFKMVVSYDSEAMQVSTM